MLSAFHPCSVLGMHPEVRRRAGTAVQVLVATADSKVGGVARPTALEIHGNRAGGMRQVPNGQHTRRVRGCIDLRHRMHAAVAVVHVREHHHRHVFTKMRDDFIGVHESQFESAFPRHTLRDIEVGRKIAAL